MTSPLLINCLVITDQLHSKIQELLPLANISTITSGDFNQTGNIGNSWTWLIIDLDNAEAIRDSEIFKTNIAFIAKKIMVISKNFNRLKYYKDFCDVFFGWNNFIEINFFC